ncbi:hypothetical protein GOODEAATRI_004407 [Goodea atripinnis]|uniref:CAP N-terminal domain-containing protein n=1 Tax=Goodea atripinnis TaxID=208336 RepID=A0ABV0MYL6_9TELE
MIKLFRVYALSSCCLGPSLDLLDVGIHLVLPVSKAIQQVQAFREQNRTSPLFNHLSAISESVPALGWVAMDAAMFYTNRVLKDYKEKSVKLLPVSSSAAPPSAPAGGCPPPPPGPPPPPEELSGTPAVGGDGGANSRNALFAALNQGSDITKGLKHVSDSDKTHKNPALRGHGAPVRTGPKPFASSSTRPAVSTAPSRKLPPVLELEGKKWKVVS